MRAAIISDIHGNLEAFTQALKLIEERNVDTIWCLGDVVGYGPDPVECLKVARENCSVILMGNHDAVVVGKEDVTRFNRVARLAALWTAMQLSEQDKRYISELPYIHRYYDAFLVHGAPFEPQMFHYILTMREAMFNFECFREKIAFIGHSHRPIVFTDDDDAHPIRGAVKFQLDENLRYIVNVGSVGQPRDGNSNPCFVIFDSGEKSIEYIRFNYPLKLTQKKIDKAGLPHFLSERLEKGL